MRVDDNEQYFNQRWPYFLVLVTCEQPLLHVLLLTIQICLSVLIDDMWTWRGGGGIEFLKFSKKGGSDFSYKKGGVVK